MKFPFIIFFTIFVSQLRAQVTYTDTPPIQDVSSPRVHIYNKERVASGATLGVISGICFGVNMVQLNTGTRDKGLFISMNISSIILFLTGSSFVVSGMVKQKKYNRTFNDIN